MMGLVVNGRITGVDQVVVVHRVCRTFHIIRNLEMGYDPSPAESVAVT